MATFNMFNDLPSIDLEYEQEKLGHNRLCGGSRPEDLPYSVRTLNAFGFQGPSPSWTRRAPLGTTVLPPIDCEERRTYWNPEHHRSQWDANAMISRTTCEGVAPWASTVIPRGYGAPSPCSADDRQVSEPGSGSDGGTWSPVISERRYDGPRLDSAELSESIYSPYVSHTSSGLLEASYHDTLQCGSGITLQDVQQYPDSYPGEDYDDYLDKRTSYVYPREYPFTCEKPVYLTSKRYCVDDDGGTDIAEAVIAVHERGSDCGDDSASDYMSSTRRRQKATQVPIRNKAVRSYPRITRKAAALAKSETNANKVMKSSTKSSASSANTSSGSDKTCPNACPHCSQSLQSKNALNKHIMTAHTRPFNCTFQLYGCSSTFASKNEWKRHVSSQHLRLGIWRCDIGACNPQPQRLQHPQQDHRDEEEEGLIFNDFNRKDLFIQHLRRMHSPPNSRLQREVDAFSASLESISRRCLMDIRQPPLRSVCGYCASEFGRATVFEGTGSWELRMEHVGRHLESGHGLTISWCEDVGLKEYMAKEGLIELVEIGQWRLVGLPVDDGKSTRTMR